MMTDDLYDLLSMIARIDRDDDGDAMLDSEGLTRLQEQAEKVRLAHVAAA